MDDNLPQARSRAVTRGLRTGRFRPEAMVPDRSRADSRLLAPARSCSAPARKKPEIAMTESGSSLTFVSWLLAQEHRDDPIGDIAREVGSDRDDRCLSRRVSSLAGLLRHVVQFHNLPDEGFDTLAEAHAAWKRIST
jgi:hypothetical protein